MKNTNGYNSAWRSEALEALQPLRWHVNELIEALESHNRWAKRAGRPTIPEGKILAAKEASAKAESFFCPKPTAGP